MTDRADVVYAENETKLLCQIRSGAICDKNKTRQRHYQSIGLVYVETKIELLGPI